MNRFAEQIVPFGFRIACRRASWPTRRSPCGVNATTEGVVRDPSAFGITVDWPPCMAAITELVVPRSMPTATAITASFGILLTLPASAGGHIHHPGSPGLSGSDQQPVQAERALPFPGVHGLQLGIDELERPGHGHAA